MLASIHQIKSVKSDCFTPQEMIRGESARKCIFSDETEGHMNALVTFSLRSLLACDFESTYK